MDYKIGDRLEVVCDETLPKGKRGVITKILSTGRPFWVEIEIEGDRYAIRANEQLKLDV
jgi:hypothetical protein